MRVVWEVEDGYCGKSRPKTTVVPDDELEACETQEERDRLIEEYVQEDFDRTISWSISHVDGPGTSYRSF